MLYNGIYIPYHLRLIGTTFEETEHSGREDEEWGTVRVTHPEDERFHMQDERERKKDE